MSDNSLLNKTILGYHVDEIIGGGTSGTVYKVSKPSIAAQDGSFIRALKHIVVPSEKQYRSVLDSMNGDEEKTQCYFKKILDTLVDEIKIINDLSGQSNANIVQYFDSDIVKREGECVYDIYILMEYLVSLPLYRQKNSMTVRDAMNFAHGVLNALILCHDNNVIHRDIKEDNVFFDPKTKVFKLGDFGVAKSLTHGKKAKSLKGTPDTMAPEVYTSGGSIAYDQRADLYSVGIMLYQMFNFWRSPFLPQYPLSYTPEDEDQALSRRMNWEIPSLPNNAPESIGKIILTALLPQEQRYKSAREFLEELKKAESFLADDELNRVISHIEAKSSSVATIGNESGGNNNNVNPLEKVASDPVPDAFPSLADTPPVISSNSRTPTIGDDQIVVPGGLLYQTSSDDRELNENLFRASGTSAPRAGKMNVNDGFDIGIATNASIVPPPSARNMHQNAPDKASAIDIGGIRGTSSDEDKPVSALSPNTYRALIFAFPVVIAIVWLILYVVILPKLYGSVVSVIDLIIEAPDRIIEILRNSSEVLPQYYTIVGLKYLNYLMVALFVFSLFLVGKALQRKSQGGEQYYCILSGQSYKRVVNIIQIRYSNALHLFNSERQRALSTEFKAMCEKLNTESDFGVTSKEVADYENMIAQHLMFIETTLNNLNAENVDEEFSKIKSSVFEVRQLLAVRTQAMKK